MNMSDQSDIAELPALTTQLNFSNHISPS